MYRNKILSVFRYKLITQFFEFCCDDFSICLRNALLSRIPYCIVTHTHIVARSADYAGWLSND